MRVLLLDDHFRRQERFMNAFWAARVGMIATGSQKVARTILGQARVDVLVMAETVQGQLTHATALFAEYRNPKLATLVLTDRTDEDVEELYQLIPSVCGILGGDVHENIVLQLAKPDAVTAQAARSGTVSVHPGRTWRSGGEEPKREQKRSAA